MDEMSMVRQLLAEPPPDPRVVAEGRERLLASPAGAAPATRTIRRAAFRGTLALGVTSAAAAAALAIATLVPGGGNSSGGGGPARSERSARTVLLAAAARAESAPTSGTYWHLRTMSTTNSPQRFGHGGNRYALERLWVHEEWAMRNGQAWSGDRTWVRPATPQDQAAWRRDGAPNAWCTGETDTQPPKPTCLHTAPGTASLTKDYFPFEVSEGLQLTFGQLQRLPANPDELRARLVTDARRHLDPSAGAAVIDQNVAAELADLLVYLPVPPGVRAAAYRALAGTPHVTSIGPRRDELGRAGVGIEIAEGRGWTLVPGDPVRCRDKHRCSPAGNITRTLIIDPGTSQVLADVTSIGNSSSSDTLILGDGWTNEKPRKPGLPRLAFGWHGA